MKLSKTNYLLYRECPHNAWLKLHRRRKRRGVIFSKTAHWTAAR